MLRGDMRLRGGYILHVDGSCEEGSGVLLVCVDSLSAQVLESRKIASENHDEVKSVLSVVRRDWGIPVGIVHDLRKALISAAAEVFPGTPQFVCHYHLAADVGKDILGSHVDRLRRLFRCSKARPKLRTLVRSLKEFATSGDNDEHTVTSIVEAPSRKQLLEYCTPEAIMGAVHALACWILAYSHDGKGYGFPFDLPYLDFYKRIASVHQALGDANPNWPDRKRGPYGWLTRLREILDMVVTGEYAADFRQVVSETERDRRIFERFRSALRICPTGQGHGRARACSRDYLSPQRHKATLKELRNSLARQAKRDGPTARACSVVVEHLDKYWDMLFGHVRRRGSRKIIVPPTNNFEEGLLGVVKRQCRRLHGTRDLSRDIEGMSPATPLLLNLRNGEYCETVFGGQEPEKVAARFSTIDSRVVARLLKTWRRDKMSTHLSQKLAGLKGLPRQVARFLSVAGKHLPADRKA
ncbi:MAG: hypothetical protein V2A71_09995 [Candidatus Eisenbacteria bacterium]